MKTASSQSARDVDVRTKVARLQQGGTLKVLDLFAGCGGLSLGFQRAGFRTEGAVESDGTAASSYATNFHTGSEIHAKVRDILSVEPEQLVADLDLGRKEQAFDVIAGGPPCQAFARIGRAKLREVAAHPEAFRHDPRASLYLQYLTYVRELKPLALLMENVPDILNYGGHNIAEEMCDALSDLGYACGYTLLSAAFYGVPQMRLRVFLLGYRRELAQPVRFPGPTHRAVLPRGYQELRQFVRSKVGLFVRHFIEPPEPDAGLPLAVAAEQAIGDLPPITAHLEGRVTPGPRRFVERAQYRTDGKPSDYAISMRNWPGFESDGGVMDHVIRYLPRDYPIFRRMAPGDEYPKALQHAFELFREELERRRSAGSPVIEGSEVYDQLRRGIVPPYDPAKFPNKWRKLEPDKPARTLMAHLAKDGYSHIHYDNEQARTISVREAARLQSFPDGFVFNGSMNSAFKQIGNAVPPLMAYQIAQTIKRTMEGLVPLDVRRPEASTGAG